MSFELLVLIFAVIIVLLFAVLIFMIFGPKPRKRKMFNAKWKELQSFCSKKETWPTALSRADELLDMALKRRRYKGSNMGERLVAAQKVFKDNDSVWQAHKFATKIKEQPKSRITEKQVKGALISLRQGLKDLDVM